MRPLSKRIVLIVSGLAVVAIAVLSKSIVPLYDGVNFPDEPYRYADASHKPSTEPPDSPSMSFTPHDAQNGLSLISKELGPQIAVYIDVTAIHLSPSVQHVVIKAQALAPTTQPADGTIAGNIYRISGSADNGSFAITSAAHDTFNSLQLRLPQGSPPHPAIEFRPSNSTSWRRIGTDQIGNDIYESTADGFGDYALVTLKSMQPSQQAQSLMSAKRNPPYLAIFLGTLVLLMATTIAAIRLRQHGKASRK